MRKAFALLAAASCGLVANVAAITRVTREGRYLYNEDGSRFYIRGIAYQEQGAVVASDDNAFGEPSTFVDPLALGDACTRDLTYLRELNVNTIRVYSVNSSLNHDSCMQTFSDAGIYTIIDLALPLNGSIDRVSPSWSTNILDQYLATIDAFEKYDNVLAYNVGNEVVTSESIGVAPYVKAAARDVRAYLDSKSSKALIGYAAIDGDRAWRNPLANFLSCSLDGQNSDATAIDLYGLNSYSWCGDSDFSTAYSGIMSAYADYNVAAYFSEYGCITSPPRLWTEVEAIFSTQMSDVWSGGIAFSYFPAESVQGQFGMVTISEDQQTVTTSEDFDRLKAQYGNVSAPNTPSSSSASYPSCPASSDAFPVSSTLPATPNDAACACLETTLSCQFTPVTANYTTVVGEVINAACSLLGNVGGSCTEIGGNGTTGTYGRISGCDPLVKAGFVMSQYYELTDRNEQSCSFAGNGTVNSNAPSSVSDANAAASSCISNPSATFAPSSVATSTGGSSGNNGGSSSSDSSSDGAVALFGEKSALLGMAVVTLVSVASGVWTML